MGSSTPSTQDQPICPRLLAGAAVGAFLVVATALPQVAEAQEPPVEVADPSAEVAGVEVRVLGTQISGSITTPSEGGQQAGEPPAPPVPREPLQQNSDELLARIGKAVPSFGGFSPTMSAIPSLFT